MDRAIEWWARNGVAANLAIVIILFGGLLTASGLKREVFPEVDADRILVSVVYPGAAPSEIEDAVVVKIEDAIEEIEEIKKITSSLTEGLGTVTAEIYSWADERDVLEDIQSAVDTIDTFPDDAERPRIDVASMARQVINLAVYGDADERTLKEFSKRLRTELLRDPNITKARIVNTRPYEISVNAPTSQLRSHNLTLQEIAEAIRRDSVNIPGGSLETEGGKILIRSEGEAQSARDFAQIPIRTRPDGARLTIGDVANVRDGFEEASNSATFDGQRAAMIQVFRVGDQDAIQIASFAQEFAKDGNAKAPPGISVTAWQDESTYLKDRQELLLRNGRNGLILVILTLALFLRVSLALWVSVGILVSFVGAFWVMPSLDVSINMLSLFAFILVLGIVVDDAIVVAESIHTEQRGGKEDPLTAAIRGCQRVARPVTFAILTTIAAFIPLAIAPGVTGQIVKAVPYVVVPTLIFSLLEALFVLPTHLGHRRLQKTEPQNGLAKLWGRVHRRVQRFEEWLIHSVYKKTLRKALIYRYITIALSVSLLILSVGLIRAGWIRWVFFPPVEGDVIAAFVTMPPGTPPEKTAEAIRQIEKSGLALRSELESRGQDPSTIRHILASIGQQPYRTAQRQTGGRYVEKSASDRIGEVQIELAPAEQRPNVSSAELAAIWRETTPPIAGALETRFTANVFSTGSPIELELRSKDSEILQRAADLTQKELRRYDAVFDITDNAEEGQLELRVQALPNAASLGLTPGAIGAQLRHAFFGIEAQTIQREDEDVPVVARLPRNQRESLGALENFPIAPPQSNATIPFHEIGIAELSASHSTIRRVNGERAITVTADVDLSMGSPAEIIRQLDNGFLVDLRSQFPELDWSWEGERREQNETISGILSGYPIAMLIIYSLLAVPFRSYWQPFIVMSAIPFGLVGAVFGHLVMGMDFTVLSLFGIVALSGVVVNDNLVLVEFINRHRDAGGNMLDAVNNAGAARFRAIALTSLTTFAGLTPILLEKSLQAKFMVPMAISLGFGVVVASAISLFLVPAEYLVLEDLKSRFRRRRTPSDPSQTQPNS